MADIKQAAKWLQSGYSVRRKEHPQVHFCPFGKFGDPKGIVAVDVFKDEGIPDFLWSTEMLLVDDWEIAE